MLLYVSCVLLLATLASAAPMMDGHFVDGHFLPSRDERTARASSVRVPRLQHELRAEYSDEDLNRQNAVDLSRDIEQQVDWNRDIDRIERQVYDEVEQLPSEGDDEQEVPMKVSFWKRLWGKIKNKARNLFEKIRDDVVLRLADKALGPNGETH